MLRKGTLILDLSAVQTWTLLTPRLNLKIALSWFTRWYCITLGSFFIVDGVTMNREPINLLETLKCVSGNITWDEILFKIRVSSKKIPNILLHFKCRLPRSHD